MSDVKRTLDNFVVKMIFKKVARTTVFIVFITMVSLSLLELAYRNYVIDFFRASFEYLNTPLLLNSDKSTILVAGDSFTASNDSYISLFRDSLRAQYRVINTAVPGIGSKENKFMLKDRIQKYKPDIFIYQVYVGNDLLDISHDINWSAVSFLRNCYWLLSDNFKVVKYLNFALGQYVYQYFGDKVFEKNSRGEAFNKERYSNRTKMLLNVNPFYLEESVQLRENKMELAHEMVHDIKAVLDFLPADAKAFIVVIPHCYQVDEIYYERMKVLGAQFDVKGFSAINYPFYNLLKQSFSSTNVEVINVLPNLQKHNSEDLFYTDDPHLNQTGQKVLGEFLLGKIVKSE